MGVEARGGVGRSEGGECSLVFRFLLVVGGGKEVVMGVVMGVVEEGTEDRAKKSEELTTDTSEAFLFWGAVGGGREGEGKGEEEG